MSLRWDSVLLLLLLLVAGSVGQCDEIITATFEEPFVVNQRDGYDGLVRMCTVLADHYSIAVAPGATLNVTVKFTHDEGNLDLEITTEGVVILDFSLTDTDNETLEVKNNADNEELVFIRVYLYGDRPAGQDSQVYTLTIDVTQTQCPTGEFLQNGKCDPCPADQFKIGTDTATSCVDWAPACASGKFQSTAPSKTQDRVCTAHTVCETGQVESEAGTAEKDTVCVECTNTTGSTRIVPFGINARDGYNGSVTMCGVESDYYKVTVAPGATLNVTIKFKYNEGDLDLYLDDSGDTNLQFSASIYDDETLVFTNRANQVEVWHTRVSLFQTRTVGALGQQYTLIIDVTQTQCPAGEFLKDKKCDPCPDGQFKAGTNAAAGCTAWATACTAEQIEARTPSGSQDRVCRAGCSANEYDRAFEDLEPDLDCHTTCLPGTEPLTRTVGSNEFRLCTGCELGKYSVEGAACTARTVCPATGYDLAFKDAAVAPDCQDTCLPGTEPVDITIDSTAFRVCEGCKAGKYSVDGAACTAHTVCRAGLIESEAITAEKDTTCVECKDTFAPGPDNEIVVDPTSVYSRNVTTCGYNSVWHKVAVAPGATLTMTIEFKHDEGNLNLRLVPEEGYSESIKDNETVEFMNDGTEERDVSAYVGLNVDRPGNRGGQVYTVTIDVTQTQCGPGEFPKSGKCTECPSGSFKIGSSAATACTAGNVCAESGIKTPVTPTKDAVCYVCPAGKYVGSEGPLMALFGMANVAGECAVCPGNTVQPQANSETACTPCPAQLVASADRTACESAPQPSSSSTAATAAWIGILGAVLAAAAA